MGKAAFSLRCNFNGDVFLTCGLDGMINAASNSRSQTLFSPFSPADKNCSDR